MPHIKHSLAIDALPERVYPLVSSGKGLTQWWAADVTETDSMGTVELGFFNRATVYRLQPTRMSPSERAEWLCSSGQEWSGTRLRFELTPSARGTLVRFTHADWNDETDYFVSCTTVWGELMFRLKAAAEGRPRGPLFTTDGQSS
jgi:uncharacterized protein YndB with AHSA1/START domain